MKVKIYYHHTDCGGVVYYANYLKFFEEARTEYFDQKGFSIGKLAKAGILFVVAHQESDFKSPAFYGDVLDVDARVSAISTVKVEFEHKVFNQDGRLICTAKAVLVCVDNNIKPKAIPDELKEKLLK